MTQFLPPLNSPYVLLNLAGATGLAPQKSIMVTLTLLDPTMAALSFKARVLAGVGAK